MVMAVDFNHEQPLSLTEAAKALPPIDGRRPHVSTLWRWIRKGVRGVHLEHGRYGRRIVTSREALARFAARLAEADDTPTAPTTPVASRRRTPAQRERDIAAAEREFAAI